MGATHERDSTSFSKILHQWMCFTCWWHFVHVLENQLPEDRTCRLIIHHKPFSHTALTLWFNLSWYRCLTYYAKFVFYYLFSDALQHGIIRRHNVICRYIYNYNFSIITNQCLNDVLCCFSLLQSIWVLKCIHEYNGR